MKKRNFNIFILVILFFSFTTCSNPYIGLGVKIIAFGFEGLLCSSTIYDDTIEVIVPDNTDLLSLRPIIKLGSSSSFVYPESGHVQDFSSNVRYTVVAADGKEKTYIVSVKNDLYSLSLKSISIDGQVSSVINGNTVNITMPYGSKLSFLKLNFETVDIVSTSVVSGSVLDFSSARNLVLTSSDKRTRTYTILVTNHAWELVSSSPGFKANDGAGLISFNNKLWLIGGWQGSPPSGPGCTSEVWCSEDDGKTWSRKVDAPWIGRHGAGWVVFNNKIFVVSGDGLDDVWSSSDGENWVQECTAAPFGKRYAPYVAVFKNKLWLLGGLSYWEGEDYVYPRVKAYNDVWSSADGKIWHKELDSTPWAPRGLIHGYAVKNDTLYILGGGIKSGLYPGAGSETVSDFNDVWSTSDGLNWTRVLFKAPWLPRSHYSVASTPEYIYITDGSVGTQANLSNEVWRSKDGFSWEQVLVTPWSPRHASSLTYHNGYLYLSSGYFVADVWRLQPQ